MLTELPTIVVTDLETTGLDVENDMILEVGVMQFRADDLKPLYSIRVVIVSPETRQWCSEVRRKAAEQESLNIPERMHLENGLVDRILANFDGVARMDHSALYAESLEVADDALVEWTLARGLENRPLVGASVGSLDRPMVQRYLPKLRETISYRNVDTSSVLEAVRLFNPALATSLAAEVKENFPPEPEHLTLEDCSRSIAMLRFTLERLGVVDQSFPKLFGEPVAGE